MSPLTDTDKARIVEEERIRAEARQRFSQPATTPQQKPMSPKQKRVLLGGILAVIVIPLVLIYWYIAIPLILLVLLWFWKKITLPKRHRLYASAAIIVASAALTGWLAYAHRTPSIEILEPANAQAFQTDTTLLKGKVTPSYATVKVQGVTVGVASNGAFEQNIKLPDENNTITITADNSGKEKNMSVLVQRTFTEEEKAERERLAKEQAEQRAKKEADRAAQQVQAQAEAEAQKKVAAEKAAAEQATFDKSKAGQYCKAHPDWSKEDCTNLANGKIWIGMKYDMLVAAYGKPNHTNPSNYGGKTNLQYCWTYKSPSCFYDNNDDGIIDAYN